MEKRKYEIEEAKFSIIAIEKKENDDCLYLVGDYIDYNEISELPMSVVCDTYGIKDTFILLSGERYDAISFIIDISKTLENETVMLNIKDYISQNFDKMSIRQKKYALCFLKRYVCDNIDELYEFQKKSMQINPNVTLEENIRNYIASKIEWLKEHEITDTVHRVSINNQLKELLYEIDYYIELCSKENDGIEKLSLQPYE